MNKFVENKKRITQPTMGDQWVTVRYGRRRQRPPPNATVDGMTVTARGWPVPRLTSTEVGPKTFALSRCPTYRGYGRPQFDSRTERSLLCVIPPRSESFPAKY